MNRFRSVISGTAAMSLFLLSVSALGADSPLATIRAAVRETLTVLQDTAYQGAARRQERLAKAEQVILANFDREEFAREALGRYWPQRTATEQQEFVRLFTDLVART